jgi:hypothetical protein
MTPCCDGVEGILIWLKCVGLYNIVDDEKLFNV